MQYKVWLYREAYIGTEVMRFARHMVLPIPPFPELAITLHEGADSEEIIEVWINRTGAVVCGLSSDIYEPSNKLFKDVADFRRYIVDYAAKDWIRVNDPEELTP